MLFVIRASIGTSGAISHYTPNHTIDNLSNVCTLAMYIQPTYAPTTRNAESRKRGETYRRYHKCLSDRHRYYQCYIASCVIYSYLIVSFTS